MIDSIVVGSGFSGLASASLLAQRGHKVTILEKNAEIGGRARQFKAEGFVFDMGPSWYWMPEIFEQYFGYFGHKSSDFFELKKLDPAFKVFFPDTDILVPGEPEGVFELFEKLEPGSSKALERFMEEAAYKYEVGVRDIIYRQPDGLMPFLNWKTIKASYRLQLLKSISSHIAGYFKHPYLRQILEFPVLFLGAAPNKTPALYSLMDYSGLMQGTWYPMGGFYEVVKAMEKIASDRGVDLITQAAVTNVEIKDGHCAGVIANEKVYQSKSLVLAGDYHHFDQKVMPGSYQQYSEQYWQNRTMSPSTLLFYIGYKGNLEGLEHHNLFFDADFDAHSRDIYDVKDWPEDPLFYVCCPSKTDPSVAPQGHENLFMLVPIAAGLMEDDQLKEHYFNVLCDRIKNKIGVDIREGIVYRKDYAAKDFIKDYNAFKGNAYGLANTLNQTAFLKPNMRHKKLKNVFHCGQLTVPGPGVPPALVSGELVSNYVSSYLKNKA